MELTIDGRKILAETGKTLKDMIAQVGLDAPDLAHRPLAAKIAGEVFNLNYIPVRSQEAQPDRPSIRRAMAASQGQVRLLRYADPTGKDVYTRTAQFVLFLALHRLWSQARGRMHCTLGPALYIQVDGAEDFSAQALYREARAIVAEDIPLIRRKISTREARERFAESGQQDKERLLAWRTQEEFYVYGDGDFWDYYYGELAPSTGYLSVWDVIPAPGGFLFLYPDDGKPNQVADYQEMPKFFQVFGEGRRWGELMACETVSDLNELTLHGGLRELIRVNEALHEKGYSQIADQVCRRNTRMVMLAGPSSSGKTTSAHRLATQLRVHGKKPVLMSLDDYYVDRDQIPVGPDGKQDLEHIDTIDTALFREQMQILLTGEPVELPAFDFKSGKRIWQGKQVCLARDSIVIVEGLHGLNPILLPEGVDPRLIFKMYVSPLLPLSLDDHNRIPTSLLRLLRRIVRDYEGRGASVQDTLAMWDSVRRGEKRWIFPFQEQADVIFNSATLYELAVLKKHIFPLLEAVEPEDSCYDQVRGIVKTLNYVQEAEVDDEIPPTSLVREFIGGNSFYR